MIIVCLNIPILQYYVILKLITEFQLEWIWISQQLLIKSRILKIEMISQKGQVTCVLSSANLAHSQDIKSLKSSKTSNTDSQLESNLLEILHAIKNKAYNNVQNSSIIMKKYQIAHEFETKIRLLWSQIVSNITEFVQIDREIMKNYCEINKTITSLLQDTSNYCCPSMSLITIERQTSQARLSKNISFALSEMKKKKDKLSLKIQSSLNIIKDYSIKKVEIITENFSPSNNITQIETEKKQSTKEYILLQQYILYSPKIQTFNTKIRNVDKENLTIQSNRSPNLIKSFQDDNQKNEYNLQCKRPLHFSLQGGWNEKQSSFHKYGHEENSIKKLNGQDIMGKSTNSVEPDTIISKILDLYNEYSFS